MKSVLSKALLLFLTFCLVDIMNACKCPESKEMHYANKKFSLFNLDNTSKDAMETDADSVKKEAYGIRIHIEREKLAKHSNSGFSLIQTAYATSRSCPPEIEYLPMDTIIQLKILSLFEFDTTHPAGSDLSDFFYLFKNNKYYSPNEAFHIYNEKIAYDNEFEANLDFLLLVAPKTNSLHQFEVFITLSDGRIIQLITQPIWMI